MAAARALAVDIGGTKLAAAVVTDDGRIERSATSATPGGGVGVAGGEAVFGALTTLLDTVRGGDETVCGVGCGGPMEAGGESVTPLNIASWTGFALRSRLADHLGVTTIVDNDAKALALGEWWRGGARGERHFVAMVVSTGVGGGIVLDGRLLDGTDGNAGHIGHVIVVPGGRPCACGGRGCLEAEASGPAIAAATGRPPEQADRETVARAGMLVGRAVASVANLLGLRLALVGGSVALGFGTPFFVAAQAELDASARLRFSSGARIRPAALGPDGPLVGAAAVGFRGIGLRSVPGGR